MSPHNNCASHSMQNYCTLSTRRQSSLSLCASLPWQLLLPTTAPAPSGERSLGLRNFSIASKAKEATSCLCLCEIRFYSCRKRLKFEIYFGFRQRQNIKAKAKGIFCPIFNDRSLIEFRIEMEMEMRIKGRGGQIEKK